ncbi:TIGR03862 family flavoprotein [Aestuariicoccus sp. MJ-SS9]|uniref:TIGR03862 family flavoprotein n=1 Tax=Aestuariicoccus sp. MJ-SS9 TaxID=3079855 RepID=UPI002910AEB4|nr:TIGR03862 family flavoprotein [Aestuariicoccus sp. MJ-SS9]MDU8912915.1 TIGR03862 family flavoprotein [Aestuariicoccus sp. MJ-SS9]
MKTALVIGGGPAGLMAADALLSAGHRVILTEAKPSLGRKFLMAGKSGLNLTKAEDLATFLAHYGAAEDALRPMLDAFAPDDVQRWAQGLGQPTFVGSSGRVFPEAMKASPLLRAWLARLDGLGIDRRTRWCWTGWDGAAARFDTPDGPQTIRADATVLALGGASWARLGSDGAWVPHLEALGVRVAPFAPANAGVTADWSDHMAPHFGQPLKNIVLSAGGLTSRGEIVLSRTGLEGGALYPLTPALREGAVLTIDLAPDLTQEALTERLSRPRGKASWSNILRKALPLTAVARALLMEFARPLPRDPAAVARLVKALPLPLTGLRPMDEAISTAGGVPFAELDAGLMLTKRPGIFCAGEMLDWEAPTGGYLLTACLATGLWAGRHAAAWMDAEESAT